MICENCGAQVDERVGVCPFCGVIQTQAKRWKQQFFVSPDHCCLCGKALNGRYQVLFTYASGDEARICEDCASLIASARNRRDPAAAQTALTRLNGMLSAFGSTDDSFGTYIGYLTAAEDAPPEEIRRICEDVESAAYPNLFALRRRVYCGRLSEDRHVPEQNV